MSHDDDRSGPGTHPEIEALEQREADAMLRGDVAELSLLWSDDLLVNSSANILAGKALLLGLIGDGRLKLKSYERRTVRLVSAGEIVIATGNETSRLDSERIRDQLFCSYMNVWLKQHGAWKLIGRHVGLIERRKTQD